MSALELTAADIELGIVPRPGEARERTAEEIAAAIATRHGVTVGAMMSKDRSEYLTDARRELYRRLKDELRWSTVRIGRFVGGRDHATVLHGLKPKLPPTAAIPTSMGVLTTVVVSAFVQGTHCRGTFGPEPTGPGWDWLEVRRFDGRPGVVKVFKVAGVTSSARIRLAQKHVMRGDQCIAGSRSWAPGVTP